MGVRAPASTRLFYQYSLPCTEFLHSFIFSVIPPSNRQSWFMEIEVEYQNKFLHKHKLHSNSYELIRYVVYFSKRYLILL